MSVFALIVSIYLACEQIYKIGENYAGTRVAWSLVGMCDETINETLIIMSVFFLDRYLQERRKIKTK